MSGLIGHDGWVQSIRRRIREMSPDRKANFTDRCFIGLALIFVIWQLHPSLILSNTTTTGGDTGAHFIVPWLAEHEVFTHFRLTGWSNAWYDGFPLLGFYFPLPSMLVAILNIFVTYNVAFKLITVLGSLIFIPSLYVLGKKFELPRPLPLSLALVGVGYLFDTSYTIDGGNLASTLAGEYSFSLSLALGIFVIAIAAKRGLTRKDMGLGALIFALATLAHILPSFWVGAALVLLVLLKRVYQKSWTDVPYTVGLVLLAAFITAFWAIPFTLRIAYSTSMGWTKVTTYGSSLFPHSLRPWLIMAFLGMVVSLWRRQILGIMLAILGVISVAAFIFLPNSAVYNARALPFWVLSLYALSGLFLGNLGILIAGVYRSAKNRIVESRSTEQPEETVSAMADTGSDGVDTDEYSPPSSLIGLSLDAEEVAEVLVPGNPKPTAKVRWFGEVNEGLGLRGHIVVASLVSVIVFLISGLGLFSPQSWLPFSSTQSFVPSWIRWNYTGYEGKADYPAYREIMVAMQNVGKKYGCGQAMWEYNSLQNSYGTPMALMLLPYWTNSCIGSMEGLFFESSATTPFHFINQSELSAYPSEAMSGLPYNGLNVALGVQHLQLLGVRYFMAFSPNVVAQANQDPQLQKIVTVPAIQPSAGANSVLGWTWNIYLVKNSAKVKPLSSWPVVLNGVNPSQASWVNGVMPWYNNPNEWSTMPAQSGPANWTRVALGSTNYPSNPVSPTQVSNISEKNSSISFNVSKLGAPVLVKESYFPNWHVNGATGPYRVAPNLMVVVPTSHHVVVYYGMTTIDYIGYGLTLLSLVGVVALMLKGGRSKELSASID